MHASKTLYESVQQQIKKKIHVYVSKTNKRCKQVVFQLGDVHKERFGCICTRRGF